MYEIVKVLEEKRFTPTRAMTVILAKCCHCGAEKEILEQNLQRSNREKRKHCEDCIQDTFHNMTDSRIWRIWMQMRGRATNINHSDSKNYVCRGIGISEEWLKFENFYRDMSATYSDDLTIDRIDNNKGYYKENCRWATNLQQQANKRNNRVISYMGQEMHLGEFCRVTGISRGAITPRLNRGMTGDEAVLDYQKSTYGKGINKRQKFTT